MEIKGIYDLSVTLRSYMPLWPTNPNVKIEPVGTVPRDGYLVEAFSAVTHSGTHIDAPAHMLEDGATIDKVSLDKLVGEGFMIKIDPKSPEITEEDIKNKWKEEYEGKILLINTGWYKKRGFTREFQYQFPGLSKGGADFLKDKRLKMIGIDTLGIEPYDHANFEVHKILLSQGTVFIEDLFGLDQLVEGKKYLIVAAPLKIENGSGSPARVLALDVF